MIKTIKVVSRAEMKTLKDKYPDSTTAVISIYDPILGYWSEDEGPLYEEERVNLLQLCFHDKVNPEPGYLMFNEEHAERIAEFITEVNQTAAESLIIHCFAGISRSAGVGRVLSEYLGFNEEYEEQHRHCQPNSLVMSLLRKDLGL